MRRPFFAEHDFFITIVTAAVSLFFFIACADEQPRIVSEEVRAVFDYQNHDKPPVSRLSVFLNTGSDCRRIRQIRITHSATGYEWIISDPVLIKSRDGQWCGSATLFPRYSENILQGAYSFTCTDLAGRMVSGMFTVTYPVQLADATAEQAGRFIGSGGTEYIVLYAESGKMLYYGARKNNWNTEEAVWKEYSDAAEMRTCLLSADGLVVCLLPPVYRTYGTVKKQRG